MFLNFRGKKLLILRDNEIGPGTDFSQKKMAFAFIQNVFEFPGKKVVDSGAHPFQKQKTKRQKHHERQGHTKTPQIKSELNPTEWHHQNADTNAKSKKQRNPPTLPGHKETYVLQSPHTPLAKPTFVKGGT
jgi:hypothetical protein